jgi:TPR repeat protein
MKLRIFAAALLIGCAACSNAHPQADLLPKLERLAQTGNAEALYHLGMAYWTGTGAPKDVTRATEYFRRAAAAGDPLGAYKMGCLYDGQDHVLERDAEKALQYKLVAARAGYALAQQDVAALYAERNELQPALEWIEKAAAQGTSGALETYASIYNGAPGVEADPVKTAAYFRLFLERTDASEEQKDWLSTFEHKLNAQQRSQVAGVVANYRPHPTPLTIKALRGLESAEELVASQ